VNVDGFIRDGSRWQVDEVVPVTEVVIPLTIRDLTPEDLPSCTWSGSATHLASIADARTVRLI
jgi:hypothetical protein